MTCTVQEKAEVPSRNYEIWPVIFKKADLVEHCKVILNTARVLYEESGCFVTKDICHRGGHAKPGPNEETIQQVEELFGVLLFSVLVLLPAGYRFILRQ